jgi:hypothetical protein
MEFNGGVSFSIKATRSVNNPVILVISMLGIPYMTDKSSKFNSTQEMIASGCELRFCVQTFAEHTSMSGAFERESPRSPTFEPHHIEWNEEEARSIFTLDNAPAEQFSFSQYVRWSLQNFLLKQVNGTHRIVIPPEFGEPWHSEDTGGDFIKNIWKSAMDPDIFIGNLAGSITDYLRTSNASHDDSLNGVAYEFGVTVRWEWIILPAALTVLSAVLLVVAIIETHRSGIAPWKCSLLRLALFEVQEPVQEVCEGRVDVYNGLEDAVGDWKVRLRVQEGRWKFVGDN